MALFPKTPGVYIQEISTLPSSVVAVPTAVPVFIGYTEKGTANTPTRITSMLEFEAAFGGPKHETFSVTLTTVSGNTAISVTPATSAGLSKFTLYYHLRMFYANGGGTCYIISVGDYSGSVSGTTLLGGIAYAEQVDEITLVCVPEATSSTVSLSGYKAINDEMLAHCAKLQDRFAIMDVLEYGTSVDDDMNGATHGFRGFGVSNNNLKYGAAYYPSLNTILNYYYQDDEVTITDTRSVPVYTSPNNKLDIIHTGNGSVSADTTLYNEITSILQEYKLRLYPSATMAGVYAAVDNTRGVWKAPANISLIQLDSVHEVITDDDQAIMNVDANTGKSVNAIRNFLGRGILVWGARTLDGNSNEWRYVNVRRLFINVEESCKKASEFVVFEPNDKNTWIRVKGMISNFLTNIWRDGALAGDKPEQAYFVKIGLGETMTPQDILEGKMIVQIGLAAVRPAEFIILQFEHKLQEA